MRAARGRRRRSSHGDVLAGVRFFDIRIAAAVTSQTHVSGKPVAELRAFHADDKVVFKFGREVMLKGASQAPVNITQSKLAAQHLIDVE